MRVPQGRMMTRPSSEGLGYLRAAEVDTSGITRGLNALANGVANFAERQAVENRQAGRLKSLEAYTDWQIKVDDTLTQQKQATSPDTGNFSQTWEQSYQNLEDEFIAGLPPDQQDEFRARVQGDKRRTIGDARNFELTQRREWSKSRIDEQYNRQSIGLNAAPDTLDERMAHMFEFINRAPGLSAIEKNERKETVRKEFGSIKYLYDYKRWLEGGRKGTEPGKPGQSEQQSSVTPKGNKGAVIAAAAQELGIDPVALATVISYETGGTYSTRIRGGKSNKYIGLIQFGPNEQRQYGANQGQNFEEQMGAVVRYLKDRGLKPGMGLLDLYSTINAGSPGLYNRSDRPGYDVARHVAEMAKSPHAKRAEDLIGGKLDVDFDENNPQYSGVPLEDRLGLQQKAMSDYNQEVVAADKARNEKEEAFRNDLFIGLEEGRYGRNEIDEAADAGLLSKYEDRHKANAILDKRDEDGRWAREGVEKLGAMQAGGAASFMPTDEDDNKRLNALIGDAGIARLNAGEGDYVDNAIIPLIRTTHVIPTDVAGTLNAMIRSNDPKKALWALDVLGRIQDEDPAAFDQRTDDKTARDVDFWRQKKEYYTEEELLNQIRGGKTQEERAARQMLREDAEKMIAKGEVGASEFVEAFDPYFSSAPSIPNIPWASVEMGKDFNAVFTEEYMRYGNVDEAKAAAIKSMQRIWGVTEIGGVKTLMKYPPEKVGYRPVNGDYGYIDRQVRRELNIPDDHKFQLLETPNKTEQEFARWKADPSQRPPAYNVVVQGPYGDWRLANGPDGKPARIYFTVSDEEKAAEERSFNLKQIEDEYNRFMGHVYRPSFEMMVGPDVRKDLDEQKREIEGRLKEAKLRADQPPAAPMLPHPVFTRMRTPSEELLMEAPAIEDLN